MNSKMILAFFLTISILTMVSVLAYNSYSNVIDAFFQALKFGSYSDLEPYLDPNMSKVFGVNEFMRFRESMYSSYGELYNYSFIREETQGKYVYAYYVFHFNRSDITFRIVLSKTDEKYQISGLWIISIAPRGYGVSILVAILLSMLGGFLGLLTFYLLGFRRINIPMIIRGILLVVITILIQPFIQSIPFFIMGITSSSEILKRGLIFITFASIYMGIVSGFFQEPLKYLLSRGKELGIALFIGLGFGLGEAILIPLLQYGQIVALGIIQQVPLLTVVISIIERYLVTMFHASTTMMFAYSYRSMFSLKVVIGLSILHGIINSFAIYYQFTTSLIAVVISYMILIGSSIYMLRYLVPKAETGLQQ